MLIREQLHLTRKITAFLLVDDAIKPQRKKQFKPKLY